MADGVAANARLWPPDKHRLKVRFRNGDASERGTVKHLVTKHYHAIPMRIRFEFLDDGAPGPSDIRVLFNTDKSSSYIGRDAEQHPGQTTMWLNRHEGMRDPDKRRLQRQADVLHEFGHALGMRHEQQHPGCAAEWNYRVLQERHGWTAEKVRQNYDKVGSWTTWPAPYDPKSIMHYPIRPGDALNSVAPVALNTVLSEGDRQLLMAIYPAPYWPPVRPTWTSSPEKKQVEWTPPRRQPDKKWEPRKTNPGNQRDTGARVTLSGTFNSQMINFDSGGGMHVSKTWATAGGGTYSSKGISFGPDGGMHVSKRWAVGGNGGAFSSKVINMSSDGGIHISKTWAVQQEKRH